MDIDMVKGEESEDVAESDMESPMDEIRPAADESRRGGREENKKKRKEKKKKRRRRRKKKMK